MSQEFGETELSEASPEDEARPDYLRAEDQPLTPEEREYYYTDWELNDAEANILQLFMGTENLDDPKLLAAVRRYVESNEAQGIDEVLTPGEREREANATEVFAERADKRMELSNALVIEATYNKIREAEEYRRKNFGKEI